MIKKRVKKLAKSLIEQFDKKFKISGSNFLFENFEQFCNYPGIFGKYRKILEIQKIFENIENF